MKAFQQTILIALCALAIGACAKKDGNFASKNAMNARAVSPATVKAALDSGVLLDFFNIKTVQAPTGYQGIFQFQVELMVNNLHTTVTTTQSGMSVSSGQKNIGGYNVLVEGVCINQECNPYYIAATASAPNGQRYGQVGYKFFRLNADASSDVYTLFGANSVRPFGTAMTGTDPSTVIGFLNQAPEAE